MKCNCTERNTVSSDEQLAEMNFRLIVPALRRTAGRLNQCKGDQNDNDYRRSKSRRPDRTGFEVQPCNRLLARLHRCAGRCASCGACLLPASAAAAPFAF